MKAARRAPSTASGPPIPGQSRVVSYRLRIARLCSLALCDRRSLKTLINRFQLHYLPEGGFKRIHLFCRHFEQMKALVVPLGNSREISIPQSTDQGALTEKQKRQGAPFKHLMGYYRRNSDPSRQSRAARVKPCGAQDDERGAAHGSIPLAKPTTIK